MNVSMRFVLHTFFLLFYFTILKTWRLHKAKKCMCVSGFSSVKKLGMVGRHNILFCRTILHGNCIFQYIFLHFSAI